MQNQINSYTYVPGTYCDVKETPTWSQAVSDSNAPSNRKKKRSKHSHQKERERERERERVREREREREALEYKETRARSHRMHNEK